MTVGRSVFPALAPTVFVCKTIDPCAPPHLIGRNFQTMYLRGVIALPPDHLELQEAML